MAGGKKTDLLTAKFSMEELRESYQQYLAPAAKIMVGKERQELVQAAGVRVESLRVSLNLEAAASADFSVSEIWDDRQNALKQTVKNTLVCGAMIQIMLGYGSELTDVFHGFIYETSIQFSDIPVMQVTVMDVKRLMADNVQADKVWTGQTRSGIFRALMEQYAVFGLNVSVQEREGQGGKGQGGASQGETETFVQRGSDLNLVRRLCRDGGLSFLVYGSCAKLTAEKEEAPILKLVWGRDLISFSQTRGYVNVKIEVRGTLKKATKKQSGSTGAGGGAGTGSSAGAGSGAGAGSAGTGGTAGSAQGSGNRDKKGSPVVVQTETVRSDGADKTGIPTSVRVIEITNMKEKDEAAGRLADEMDSVKETMYAGRGSCIGMPVLIPGRYIGIDGIDSEINGDYFLKSVNHTFGADGFTTEFTLGGKKEKNGQ